MFNKPADFILFLLTLAGAITGSIVAYSQVLKKANFKLRLIDKTAKAYTDNLYIPLLVKNSGAKAFYAYDLEWEITEVDDFELKIFKIDGKVPNNFTTINLNPKESRELIIVLELKAHQNQKEISPAVIQQHMKDTFRIRVRYHYDGFMGMKLFNSEILDITKSVKSLLEKKVI